MLLASNSEYHRIIGRLLYITNTKPEISYVVSKLSQFLDCATDKHFEAALRVLKYAKGAPTKELFFSATTDFTPSGFSDSDWATCPYSRRSVTRYYFFLGTSIIYWKSNKQDTITTSSCEAEYRALASATKEAQWLAYMMKKLQIEQQKPIIIYCDSQSALHIAANAVYHERTKHIEVNCYIVREKWQEGVIKLLPIFSSEQTANILTKALAPSMFKSCESKLGLLDIYNPNLRGDVI
ncbi:secreted RxLR effector protein 161-like [Arachis hypogaea]|uniref:secreted RxLR effector protein 161-like n=1 Tax=Arachis hypogaea TaxID=3818 RepID=UPI003B21FA41